MYELNTTTEVLEIIFNQEQDIEQVINDSINFVATNFDLNPGHLNLLLRELLLNAVHHGNDGNAEKKITCRLTVRERDTVEVVISDEGEGFDHEHYRRLFQPGGGKMVTSGYGLLFTLADQILFADNGSRITLIYKPQSSPVTILNQQDNLVEILFLQDLTATIAEELRKQLMAQFDQDKRRYRFDLQHVQDIDSVCLAVLLSFGKMVKQKFRDGSLEVIHSSQDIHTLFVMIGLPEFYRLERAKEYAN